MPLTIFWLLFLGGLLFYLLKRKRTGIVLGFLSFVWMAIISFPFVPDLLVRSLESRYSPLSDISKLKANDSINILVLGAGASDNKCLPLNDRLSSGSMLRLLEAIRLNGLLPASKLILRGSLPDENVINPEPFMQTALALGVEENKIRLLGVPKNTITEASEYTRKFGTGNTLLLVTDAMHMPRAMFLFQKTGQKPIPAPTNHLLKSDGRKPGDWLPSALNIFKMEYAMHEILGLAWAKLR
jgi:uncharacterized SAM-binding protein YcdF (DUF218 family)